MSKFPFFNMQQLNLDWLMKQMQRILAFLPINSGTAGQILQRGSDSARWVNIGAVSMDIHGMQTAEEVRGADELPVYNTSVEGNRKMTISALASMLPSPTAPVTSVNGKTGAVVLDAEDVGALPDSYTAPVTSVNGMTGDVIVSGGGGGAVDSVNGKTGNVILTASDVGAMPDSYTAPVSSVNGQTGNVTLGAADVGALPDTYTAPVTSVNGQTGAVVIPTGGNADMVFGTPVDLTVTAPADTTVPAHTLQGQTAGNGKYLRISGIFRVLDSQNNGWKTLTLSGVTVARPPSEVLVKGIAIRFSDSGVVYTNDVACNLRVSTAGVIMLDVLVQYSHDNSTYGEFIMLPVIVPLA